MRIAQVSPLYESVPPQSYGGTERVVSYLTEELVRQGHDVTLYASGDSVTRAKLVPTCERSLRTCEGCIDQLAHHVRMLELVAHDAPLYDLIHYHVDYLHFSLSRRVATPSLTTLHGRLDIPDLVPLYREFRDAPVVSISHAQREPLPWIAWQATVYHGLPLELLGFHGEPGDYLAFLGRISPEKGIERAIEIARRAGVPLRVAAKIDKVDREYFAREVEPLFELPGVEYVGEIDEHEKSDFLGRARALLFPIDWPEPFGLVMIEALACGTPVIAHPRGSVPEVIEDGWSGFLVETVEEAVEAVARLGEIDRAACRRAFEERYSAPRMARDYARVYAQLVARSRAAQEALR